MAKKIFNLLAVCILSLVFCRASFGVVEGIVAVVNDEVITQKDINEFASMMYLQHAAEYKDKKELDDEVQRWRKDAVERLIEDRLLVQEAKNKKVVIEPELVNNQIEEMKKQFASADDFEKTLVAEGLNINDVKRKINEQLLMRKVVEQEVREKIYVSPTEVTAFYEGHKDEIKEPEAAEVDSIFIPVHDSDANARKMADAALLELKNGVDFATVAKKYSDSPSLGKVTKGELKKEIEEVIFSLKKDEVSSVVQTTRGYYVFKLINLIPAKQLEIQDAQDQIQRMLFADKFEKKFTQWMEELKNKAYIHVK